MSAIDTDRHTGLESPDKTLVKQWIADFVLRPHPELNRTGPVCPFVEPAMQQDTFPIEESPLDPAAGQDGLMAELRAQVRAFDQVDWQGRNRVLHAMLVLFPAFTAEDGLLLDEAQARLKDELVPQNIMMAPFHPLCEEPATRNPYLRAFRSPVPMVAIRRLAFHDILFLYEQREWFFHYARQHGRRYRHTERLDPLFVKRYQEAVSAFGDPLEAD